MLQQTTVATVGGYFGDFMTRWPTVSDLAAASLDEVLHAWQGLGYYARARNLHRCAKAVAALPGARFPDSEAGLRELPGIGAYTAAAVAAIALRPAGDGDGRQCRARDGAAVRRRAAAARRQAGAAGACRIADSRSTPRRLCPGGDGSRRHHLHAAQATLHDLPLVPPIAVRWRKAGRSVLPLKRAKAERPVRRGGRLLDHPRDGAVRCARPTESGLLGGMMEIPSTPWREKSGTRTMRRHMRR